VKRHGALLVIERIAGKDHTTMRCIADMRTLCRVEAGPPLSTAAEQSEGSEQAQTRALAKLAELRGVPKGAGRK
jgi:hypothetical protein